MIHNVKSWSSFYKAIVAGNKTHDLRDMKDRNYQVGDTLILEEYEPFLGAYTGNKAEVEVTYITSKQTPCAFSSAVLDKDFAILSLKFKKEIK